MAKALSLPDTAMGRMFIHSNSEGDPHEPGELNAETAGLRDLVGKRGVAESDLRPVGRAKIDGERHEVLAQVAMVEEGTPIEVMSVVGTEIMVRPIRDS